MCALWGRHRLYISAFFFIATVTIVTASNECKLCQYLAKTFIRGFNRTGKLHFGGGNTDWEERKLGSFKTSESRFVEIMETVCKKESEGLDFSAGFDSVKDLQFKCHSLTEENEELLEKWFFHLQETSPDLEAFLCVDELKRCCPSGHFGAKCVPCPGLVPQRSGREHRACFGRGQCLGDGTRKGEGKCDCDRGYVGKMCSNCDAHYFTVEQNSTFIQCAECFDGCGSGCTSEGPKGCIACRSGYIMDTELGCKDIDECLDSASPKCPNENEVCVNQAGSYRCDCVPGFRRNSENQLCEVDIEETVREVENDSGESEEKEEANSEQESEVEPVKPGPEAEKQEL